MKRRAAVAATVVAVALLALLAALAWRYLSHAPNTGKNIFDDPAAFTTYVDGLGLAALPAPDARNRLMLEGFRCELFADGGSSCYRRVQGSNCGELQFVDLAAPGADANRVSTRFGLTCR